MAGILKSFRALVPFLAPTNLSLKRLEQGHDDGGFISADTGGAFTCWGFDNQKCSINVPKGNGEDGQMERIEIKTHGHMSNTYYALAAIV